MKSLQMGSRKQWSLPSLLPYLTEWTLTISSCEILKKSIPSDRAITRAKTTVCANPSANSVVFALVIALSDGMDFNNIQLRDIAEGLQSKHSLLGRSLDLLTEHIKGSTVGLVLETIIR